MMRSSRPCSVTQRPKFAPYAFMATAFWSIALVLQLTVPYFRKFP